MHSISAHPDWVAYQVHEQDIEAGHEGVEVLPGPHLSLHMDRVARDRAVKCCRTFLIFQVATLRDDALGGTLPFVIQRGGLQ